MSRYNNVNSLNSSMSGMRIENSSTASKWGSKLDSKKTAVKESQPKIPAVPEGDGFTTVSHAKPRTIDKPSNRNNGARRSPPSAAAQSRRGVYEPATKATSHYKQSCLPIDERDPKLVEIEANKGMTYRKSDFRPGMIVRGYLHEQDYIATSTGSNLTIKDHNRTDSRYGPICTKARKMIILVMFEDHYLAVPLFTHNGNGLAYKTKPMEFVSIRDHRVVGNHPPPQSDNPPLETEFINRGIEQFDPKSAAHITYVLPRRYELPVVMEGRLTLASLNGLIDLFNYYAPRCLKDASRRKL